MYMYFPTNYVWSMSVVATLNNGGLIDDVDKACRPVLEASGVVRWCFQNSKRKDDFHVGIQFDELPPAEARKIVSMREWFTSPSLRGAKTRIGQKKGDGLEFTK